MNSLVPYICLTGLFLPLLILYFNKGYRTANRYLAGFLFFASLYLLENFQFFYGKSLFWVAFFTNIHAFFYLIGPFSFFYVRSILSDNSKLSKTDYFHLALFAVSLMGYIPYFFSSWDYKISIAKNISSENWDMASFHLNQFIPHKMDQGLNVLQTYFYAISLWYLLWHHKKVANNPIVTTTQYKLIRNWLFIFTGLVTIITLNFTVAMANMWCYDDKSIFLNRASDALLLASVIYIGMNMTVMFFPHIMYGLPIEKNNTSENKLSVAAEYIQEPLATPIELDEIIEVKGGPKIEALQLYSDDYILTIEQELQKCITKGIFLNPDFRLAAITEHSGIPPHHMTYYFNSILHSSFSKWRNKLRIEYALIILNQRTSDQLTLEAIGLKVGFKSNSTFIRSFKKVAGKTPSDYLESIF